MSVLHRWMAEYEWMWYELMWHTSCVNFLVKKKIDPHDLIPVHLSCLSLLGTFCLSCTATCLWRSVGSVAGTLRWRARTFWGRWYLSGINRIEGCGRSAQNRQQDSLPSDAQMKTRRSIQSYLRQGRRFTWMLMRICCQLPSVMFLWCEIGTPEYECAGRFYINMLGFFSFIKNDVDVCLQKSQWNIRNAIYQDTRGNGAVGCVVVQAVCEGEGDWCDGAEADRTLLWGGPLQGSQSLQVTHSLMKPYCHSHLSTIPCRPTYLKAK